MKLDFKEMEDEMEGLMKNMDQITDLSEGISRAFAGKRTRVQELSASHDTLKQLQLIFDLPVTVQRLANEDQLEEVRT